jgi:exodeoxyribonuclease VII large subunit
MNTFKNMTTTNRLSSRPSNQLNRNVGADTSAITVSQLNRQVKSLLENSFLNIRVQGELSNFAKPSSGHWYFTLKDKSAQIRCAMFKGSNRHINFNPKEGDEVVVQAKVSLYEGRGDYQLICQSMEEAGSGRLQLAFEQLKAKLLKEGLFDSSYKKNIPPLIQHLAVITSPSGAAIHDVLSVLKRRFPGLKVSVFPSLVQGNEAADSVIKALELAQQHGQCDAVLITRGGGSLEDLWSFNEEKLARAIFKCKLPTISAIGHEVDFSICDLVADHRAATPSAAAEFLSPDQDSLKITIDRLHHRLQVQIKNNILAQRNKYVSAASRLRSPTQQLKLQSARLENLRGRLSRPPQSTINQHQQSIKLLKQRVLSSNPLEQIKHHIEKVDSLKLRITQLIDQINADKHQQLYSKIDRLNSVNPLATLSRGYSITRSKKDGIISSASQLQPGARISNQLHEGVVHSIVESVESN